VPRRSPTAWIVGGVIALIVVVAAVVAIASSGGDDGGNDANGGSSPLPSAAAGTGGPSNGDSGSAIQQNRPVMVSGTPLTTFDADQTDGSIGAVIPTVTGEGFDGTPVTIAPGTPTLVAFVAHWCPHCQREVPRLVQWHADGQVPAGVDVIAVSTAVTDQRDNYPPSDWLQREQWPWPVMADSANTDAANAFGLSSFPYFVMYGADGKVLFRESGEIPMDELTSKINDALGR